MILDRPFGFLYSTLKRYSRHLPIAVFSKYHGYPANETHFYNRSKRDTITTQTS